MAVNGNRSAASYGCADMTAGQKHQKPVEKTQNFPASQPFIIDRIARQVYHYRCSVNGYSVRSA
jgi:hypothetical protein